MTVGFISAAGGGAVGQAPAGVVDRVSIRRAGAGGAYAGIHGKSSVQFELPYDLAVGISGRIRFRSGNGVAPRNVFRLGNGDDTLRSVRHFLDFLVDQDLIRGIECEGGASFA